MDSPAPILLPDPPAPHTRRSAQLALATFLVVMGGLLAFRGYGNRLAARPTETVATNRVDLNHADRTELEQVPTVGPTLAKAIDDHRQAGGTFRTADDLRGVHGFGAKTVEKVRPFVQADTPSEPPVLERRPTPAPAPAPRAAGKGKIQPGGPPINVNTATADELMRLPGVGPVMAQNILAARTAKPFPTVNDLDRVKGIGPKTLDKLRPFVVVK
jgi:competence protein ComEA